MSEKAVFDYIDNDPLVLITLINPLSNKKVRAYAYLDTGSDAVVIPKDLWVKLRLEMLNRANVSAVGGVVTTWYTWLHLQFLEDYHRNIIAFYQDDGDVLIGRNVIDKYSVTFDGRNSILIIGVQAIRVWWFIPLAWGKSIAHEMVKPHTQFGNRLM